MRVRHVNRSATVAWSPRGFVALGTAAGTMSENFDPTGLLELYSVDFNDGEWRPFASIKTDNKVHRLAWSGEMTLRQRSLDHGILAGGMDNGNITLWNPAALIKCALSLFISIIITIFPYFGRERGGGDLKGA